MTTQTDPLRINPYLHAPIPSLFFKTAAPIVLFMVINGLYVVVDALILGLYAGSSALTAVTLTFPLSMIMLALSTMAGAGMASLLARTLGAGDSEDAQAIFGSAHALTFLVAFILAFLFLVFGHGLVDLAADHDTGLARQGWRFIAIMVYCSPITFALSLQGDALRSEGKAGAMAMLGIAATLLNIVFNYLLIAIYGFGTAGSAVGTITAQTLALAFVLSLRARGKTPLSLAICHPGKMTRYWRGIVTLGLPPSLGFAGIALASSVIIANLQIWGGSGYAETVAAYGIITRIQSFAYLPLLALSLACQSIAGNNYGAKAYQRTGEVLAVALITALVYAAALEALMILFPQAIGGLFVKDQKVIGEISHILPIIALTYVISAPMVVLAGYYQALGHARMAGILSLAKPYLILVPLIFALPVYFSENGIWFATPVGDLIMLVVTGLALSRFARRSGARFGVLFAH